MINSVDEPAPTVINGRLRDDDTADRQRGLDAWNKIIDRTPASPSISYSLKCRLRLRRSANQGRESISLSG